MSAHRRTAKDTDSQLTLAVDMIRCDGHGICAWLMPERIWLDRWGYPVVDPTEIEGADRDRALRAVRACPRGALTATTVPASGSSATLHR